jgi:hypothetical protein
MFEDDRVLFSTEVGIVLLRSTFDRAEYYVIIAIESFE